MDLDIYTMDALDSFIEEQEKLNHINFKFYTPHPKHLEFHNLGKVAKERLFLAANRIGKTMACSLEVCMHLTGNYPDWWKGHKYDRAINVWVGGVSSKEVYGILERRYFEGVAGEDPWIHPDLVLSRNRMDHTYRILHKTGRISILRFKTYEQGRESWQGEKCDLIHLDEEPPLNIYTEALMRLMATSDDHYGMMMVSATCLFWSEFVQNFTNDVIDAVDENGRPASKQVLRPSGDVRNSRVYIMAGWDDAPHISDEEQTRFKSAIPAHELEARSKGVPSIGSGMVYPVSESVITYEPFDLPSHYYYVAGMDFGWKDPTALVFMAIDMDTSNMYVFHEYSLSEHTPKQHLMMLSEGVPAKYINWIPIVHDPAGGASSQKDGESLIHLYSKAGLSKMHKANNSREAGAQTVLQALQNGRLKISKNCPKILSELRMYARDEKGKIKDGNDHLLDALRYAVMSGSEVAESANRDIYNSQFYSNRSTGYI